MKLPSEMPFNVIKCDKMSWQFTESNKMQNMVPFPEEESANQQNQEDGPDHGVLLGQRECHKLPSSKLLLIKQRPLFGLSDINSRPVVKDDDNENIKAVYQQTLTL